jgi:hypothetical protein
MDPNMDRGDRKKCIEAGSDTLPPDHKATIFLLEPSKCALGLKPRHDFFDRSAQVFLGLPDPFWDLRPNTALPSLLPEGFRLIPFLCRDDLETFAGTTPFPGAHLDRIEPR